jgi:hypothetical protein
LLNFRIAYSPPPL